MTTGDFSAMDSIAQDVKGNGATSTLAPPRVDAKPGNGRRPLAPALIPEAERRHHLRVGKIIPAQPVPSTTKLSIVVPMFNEEENLQHTVDRLAETLKKFEDGAWEVILVNDGSTDNTWERALILSAKPGYSTWLRVVGYSRNRGRGFALRTGFAAARGEWVTSTDADLSYDPEYILDLLKVLREEENVDLVIASAYMPGGNVEGLEYKRLVVSKLGNKLLSWFMSPPKQKVHTITCVFRAYRRYVLDSLELESDGKDLHLEILSKAIMLGYNFKEVPVTLRVRKHGKSKHVLMPTVTSHLAFALFERPILVFGAVGLLMIIGGLLGMAQILTVYLAHKFDPVHHAALNPERPMMTIIVLFFLGGIQLVSFGIIGSQFVNLRKEIIRIQARIKSLVTGRSATPGE